jgi:hypothetical protein
MNIPREGLRRFWSVLAVLLILSSQGLAQDMVLEYVGRYIRQPGEPDELLDVIPLGDSLALVSGNLALALVDLTALPLGGTTSFISRMTNINARDIYLKDGTYIYANLHRPDVSLSTGFAVIERVGNTLYRRSTVKERKVFFEKMCIDGNYLYVAAHSHGIRIYDLADPLNPTLTASLDSGFVDAFDVVVAGDTAYIADGAGGLKIMDVSDVGNPVILGGEDLSTALGTAEAVTWRNGHVYLAAGGAGVILYRNGDPLDRTVYPVDSAAEDLEWVEDYLAVTDFAGVCIYRVAPGGELTMVAREGAARRGPDSTYRSFGGVGSDGNLVLCAAWSWMEVFRLIPASESPQADITPSTSRIRFAPGGGTKLVTLSSDGAGDLVIDSVAVTVPAISVSYSGGTIAPDDTASFWITHDGTLEEGTGLVRFYSNDPEENPLAIQVFANTTHLDPGEASVDFTLPVFTKNHETGQYEEDTFTLSDHLGKIVWMAVYGSW